MCMISLGSLFTGSAGGCWGGVGLRSVLAGGAVSASPRTLAEDVPAVSLAAADVDAIPDAE